MSGRQVVAQRLVDFWKKELYTDDNGNKVHPEDKETILVEGTAISCGEGDFANRIALHLKLLPVPYVGNLTKADIFLAVINPTVGPQDYPDNKEPVLGTRFSAVIEKKSPPRIGLLLCS